MPPGRLAVVPGVSRHVHVEAVEAGPEANDLSLDEDSVRSLLQQEGARDVDVSSPGHQLNNLNRVTMFIMVKVVTVVTVVMVTGTTLTCLGGIPLYGISAIRTVADSVSRHEAEETRPDERQLTTPEMCLMRCVSVLGQTFLLHNVTCAPGSA